MVRLRGKRDGASGKYDTNKLYQRDPVQLNPSKNPKKVKNPSENPKKTFFLGFFDVNLKSLGNLKKLKYFFQYRVKVLENQWIIRVKHIHTLFYYGFA